MFIVENGRKEKKESVCEHTYFIFARVHSLIFFFFASLFSGHGAQLQDKLQVEADGMNEAVVPTDHAQTGPLVDNDVHELLVSPLPEGVTLHAVVDSCHSGTSEFSQKIFPPILTAVLVLCLCELLIFHFHIILIYLPFPFFFIPLLLFSFSFGSV